MSDHDLVDRTFKFSVEVIPFLRTMKYTKENDVIRYQLAKSATSIGANYEEAQGAFSKDDFRYKISICLKEAKESNYWLRIVKETKIDTSETIDRLINESDELKKILASILLKLKSKG